MAEHRTVPRATAQPKAGRSVPGTRVGSVPSGQSSLLDDGFRGPQVCQLVGISYRQLDYWARTGLLRPSLAEAKGSGTKRRYSYRDLLELKVIKRLLDAGVSLQSARRAVGCLREDLGADLAAANLVLSDTTSVLAHSDGELVDLLAGAQGVFNILPLSGVVSELDAAIVEFGQAPSRTSIAEAGSSMLAGGGVAGG